MNQIATLSTFPQLEPDDRLQIEDAKNSMVGGDILRDVSHEVRHRAVSFMRHTDEHLKPAKRSEIEAAIASLMMAFHSARNVSKTEAEITVRKYAEALVDFPIWAVRAGFRKIERGEVEGASLDFPPAAPRLCQVVSESMAPMLKDRHLARVVLASRVAPPASKVMKGRVDQLLEKYGLTWGIGNLPPANEALMPAPKAKTKHEPLTPEEVQAHYKLAGGALGVPFDRKAVREFLESGITT